MLRLNSLDYTPQAESCYSLDLAPWLHLRAARLRSRWQVTLPSFFPCPLLPPCVPLPSCTHCRPAAFHSPKQKASGTLDGESLSHGRPSILEVTPGRESHGLGHGRGPLGCRSSCCCVWKGTLSCFRSNQLVLPHLIPVKAAQAANGFLACISEVCSEGLKLSHFRLTHFALWFYCSQGCINVTDCLWSEPVSLITWFLV